MKINLIQMMTPEIHNMVIVAKDAFLEGNKYYPQVFISQYLYKL